MKRWLVMAAALIGSVIGAKLLLENALGIDTQALATNWLMSAGTGSALVVFALLASDIFLPVPSSLVMVLSGAAFGVTKGALIALAGSVLGEWAGFELVRRYGQRLAIRLVGEQDIRTFNRFFTEHGAAAVVVTRPLPVVMETISVIAGLSQMTRTTFLVASVVGTAPVVVLYAYAGAYSRAVGNALPAVVIMLALATAGWLVYRSRAAKASSRESPASS